MAKLLFGSPEWIRALQTELNNSPAYADAAKDWEGDFYFVIEPDGSTEPGGSTRPHGSTGPGSSLQDTVYMYMDLWHGKCRAVSIVTDPRVKSPAFVMSGKYGRWKQVVMAQLDPIQALMTGKLKLKGNMVMVMKHVRAAQEIVRACTRVDTEFAP